MRMTTADAMTLNRHAGTTIAENVGPLSQMKKAWTQSAPGRYAI